MDGTTRNMVLGVMTPLRGVGVGYCAIDPRVELCWRPGCQKFPAQGTCV